MATDDEWVLDEANMELVRVHKQMRKALYQPKEGLTPIPLEFLDTKRKTIMEFHEGRSVVKPVRGKKGSPDDIISKGKPEDSSKETGATGSSPPGKAPVKRRVRTKGSVPPGGVPKVAVPPAAPEDDPDLQDIDPSLPEDTEEFLRGAPEVSSLEPRRIALPLPGQEVSRATHVRKAEQRC